MVPPVYTRDLGLGLRKEALYVGHRPFLDAMRRARLQLGLFGATEVE